MHADVGLRDHYQAEIQGVRCADEAQKTNDLPLFERERDRVDTALRE
jgi:hypothetical protein